MSYISGRPKNIFSMLNRAKFYGLIALACSTLWAKGGHKLSPDLKDLDPKSETKVIIQWNTDANDSKHQKVKKHGGALRSTLQSIKAGAYSVPASALDSLADDPDVRYISPDRPLSGKLDNSAAAVNASAGVALGCSRRGPSRITASER